MGFVLYDLYFDIAWPLSPHNHYIVEVVIAILLVYIVFAVISLTALHFSLKLLIVICSWVTLGEPTESEKYRPNLIFLIHLITHMNFKW